MTQYIVLFFQFCKFSVLCFGGGYMLIPLLTAEFVDREGVLTMDQFGNLLSVAQVTPGPVGLNTATYVGFVNGGFFGSLAASLGLIAPTIVIGCSAAAAATAAAAAAASGNWAVDKINLIVVCKVCITI